MMHCILRPMACYSIPRARLPGCLLLDQPSLDDVNTLAPYVIVRRSQLVGRSHNDDGDEDVFGWSRLCDVGVTAKGHPLNRLNRRRMNPL